MGVQRGQTEVVGEVLAKGGAGMGGDKGGGFLEVESQKQRLREKGQA